MATDLTRSLMGWGGVLSLTFMPAIASAQTLPDPTKPPAEISGPPGAMVSKGNDLQTIIISPSRRAAIINGQTVELGAKVGDVRLIEVSESGVVLQGSEGRQVLRLFPNVKINRKAALPSMEDKVKRPIQKKTLVNTPDSQTGKREEE